MTKGLKNKMRDWTNEKFGYLTVLEFIEVIKVNKRYKYLWKCICSCGTIKILDINDLKKGTTNSCGCLKSRLQSQRKQLPKGVAAFNYIYYNSYIRQCSRTRKIEFDISKEDFKRLIDQNCFYCNKPPSNIKKSKTSQYIYNGLDRIDNSLGYKLYNVVPCCKECNVKKGDITKDMIYKLHNLFENGNPYENS